MGKTLIITEKPSVGRDISKVLKCTKKGNGYLFSDNYIISWAIGHLVTLYEPEDYNIDLKKWKFETLPIIPKKMKLKAIDRTKKQLKVLYNLMNSRNIDLIVCATDSGREGELIFRYIYELVKCKKPFNRLWISSMTYKAIKEGFDLLKESKEYDNLYYSARCRSEADWLVGINATRAYTIKYNTLLSIGRVQTPTLAILVKRQKEINEFKTEDYWEVKIKFLDYDALWIDIKNKITKINCRKKAIEINEKIKYKKSIVSSIEKEEKKQLPPLLYDLTQLQRDCNKSFGYSAKKTLSIAQNLYEKRKYITYPRTSSQYLSNDIVVKINDILKKLDIEEYSKYLRYIKNLDKLPITKRIVNNSKVTDHHAIIPTDVNINLKSLTNDEFNVYNLIVKRFLAVFYDNYIYNITRVISKIDDEHFISKGTTVINLGWMELYKDYNKIEKSNKEEFINLPNLKEGDVRDVVESEVLDKKTKPPKLYTESSLLSAMENAGRFTDDENLKEQLKESGIGTPATRAAIIERLLSVKYIVRKGRSLVPTEKGMKLIEIVPEELKSPETTGKWEKALNSIEKGRMDSNRFMESINRYVNYIIQSSKISNKFVVFEESSDKYKKLKKKRSTK